MNKFCLGTAQFGLNYGVANKSGKPTLEKSLEILNCAYDLGIRCFDTAQAYGNSEEILSKFISSKKPEDLKIISKLLPHAFDKDSDCVFIDVEDSINTSLKRLTVKELDGFLFHTPEYIYREDIVEQMTQCREKGLVKNIGVSIYEVEHALDAVRMDWVDYIQVPYSIFDQRLNHNNFFHLAKKNHKTVFARSAFLQGLTLMNVEDVHKGLEKAIVHLRVLDKLCDKYCVSRLKVAELFSLNDDRIDFFVFGSDTLAQLKEVLEISETKALPEALIKELREKFSDIEQEIIMPNLWKIKR